MKIKGCYSGAILKNDMKKRRDKDKFLSRLRMPFEEIFFQDERRHGWLSCSVKSTVSGDYAGTGTQLQEIAGN